MQSNKIQALHPHLHLIEKEKPLVVQEYFALKVQMPDKQIEHFLSNAAQQRRKVIIQFNPTDHHPKYSEVCGYLYYLSTSDSYLIKHPDYSSPYVVNPQLIRHIRLAEKA